MSPTVRLLRPAVELILKVQVVREEPARLEVTLQKPVLPLRLKISVPANARDQHD
ncbi:MAG: hypothetical protein WB698_04960 [Solirubrobacteraceae bacterium]